jgi:N-acetylmuramoyl-L-alanine amidase
MTNTVRILIIGVDLVLYKFRMGGITVLLAISAIALFTAYTHIPAPPTAAQPEQAEQAAPKPVQTAPSALPVDSMAAAPSSAAGVSLVPAAGTEPAAAAVPLPTTAPAPDQAPVAAAAPQSEQPAPPAEAAKPARGLISIDPGHQRKGNGQQEPISPDSHTTKPKVTGGTTGVSTGKPEYVLNLEVAVLLKQALISRGFEVLMTREEHDVDISNIERAQMANDAYADLAVRIHADGAASPKATGFSVLYPDPDVRITQSIQPSSLRAAEAILDAMKKGTGASSRGLAARSDLSGFNWSKVPVVLIEMGFMTNPSEDEQMSDPEYQQQIAEAIAEGIDTYMSSKEE